MNGRVLLVLASSTGGTGRHVASLVRVLSADGWSVTVAGPAATESSFGFGAAGADFVPVPVSAVPRAAVLQTLRRLGRHADVVHAHSLRAGQATALALPRRTPLVVTWHNAVLGGAPRRLAGRLGAALVSRRATVSLVVSADLGREVRRLGGRDVRPGPVAAPLLGAPARPAAEVLSELGAGGRPLLLAVGRLHPQKGYPALIEAACRLSTRDTAPLTVIAGDGPARAGLAELIEQAHAPVRLLGHRDDVADLLGAADIVVLPSIWEGSPLAAQEALRAGRPLVVTDVGGIADVVGDGALLVPPDDPAALAGAVAGLLDDPAARQALAARARAAARGLPDETQVADRVAALYRELLGVSRRR